MNFLLILTTLFTGIMAGLFFAWNFSVMNGLGKLQDKAFVGAMQSLNREIQNPVFFLFLFGTLILLPACAFAAYRHLPAAVFRLVLAAAVLYAAGVIGVTMAGNVPLNSRLDRFVLQTATDAEIASARKNFEGPWNRLNVARMLANVLSFLLLILAALKR